MDPQITTTPATARTDVPQPDQPIAAESITPAAVRLLGLALTVGTLAWATSVLLFGTVNDGVEERIGSLTGVAFQLGLFALLAVQIRTRATGDTRVSRAMLKVELGLLAPATLWSLLNGLLPESAQDHVAMGILDVFWPLSMLGMLVIGVKLAVAGRWRGPLRWWPLIAESWFAVTMPALILAGEDGARWIGGGHLLLGYATLGLLLTLRPSLVLPR
ncbi:hypothetical protein ACIBG7_17585 [Nonomuraea sp. NPDC050328]|uniref:hypothetical protein n=1 Tax=Nonomuraea sp. NPDC050328 TaxID=3364361 RepID=UPI00379DF49D